MCCAVFVLLRSQHSACIVCGTEATAMASDGNSGNHNSSIRIVRIFDCSFIERQMPPQRHIHFTLLEGTIIFYLYDINTRRIWPLFSSLSIALRCLACSSFFRCSFSPFLFNTSIIIIITFIFFLRSLTLSLSLHSFVVVVASIKACQRARRMKQTHRQRGDRRRSWERDKANRLRLLLLANQCVAGNLLVHNILV